MPKVQTYGAPTVASTLTPSPQLSTGAPDAAFMPPKPIDGTPALKLAADVWQDERNKADQVAVTDASGKLTALETDLLHGQNGILNKEGADALAAPETLNDEWSKGVSEISKGLTTDRQRAEFEKTVGERYGAINRQVQEHVAGESKKYDIDKTKALVEGETDAGIRTQDSERVKLAINNTVKALTEFGDRHGAPKEQVERMVSSAVSEIHVGRINDMLANDRDIDAKAYFDENKDQIAADNLPKLEANLQEGSTRGESQRISDSIMTGTFTAKPSGMVEQGNINLGNRPRVKNADGTVSTVRSISINEDGKEILLPTVSDDGKILSTQEAIDQYHRTGKHLGKFSSEAAATRYAQQLHQSQAKSLTRSAPTQAEADSMVRQIDDPKLRDEVQKRVDYEFSKQRERQRGAEDNAFQSASAIIDNHLGADPRSVIPVPMWSALTLEQKAALKRYSEAGAGKDGPAGVSADRVWLDFASLQPTDVAKLTRSELETQYLQHLGKRERGRAITAWIHARSAPDPEKNPDLRSAFNINEQITQSLYNSRLLGNDEKKTSLTNDEIRLKARVSRRVEDLRSSFAESEGRRLTSKEETAIVDQAVLEEAFNTPGKKTIDVKERGVTIAQIVKEKDGTTRVPYGRIPDSERASTEAAIRKAGGNITRERVERAYAAGVMGDVRSVRRIIQEK